MKLPSSHSSGIGTMGLLGITLMVLSATGFIHNLWLIAAIFFITAGIGSENNR